MLGTSENTGGGVAVNNWTVMVNGKEFTRYKSFGFSRDIKNGCGEFSVVTTNTLPKDYPIQLNDKLEILYRNIVVFTGVGDKLKCSGGLDGNTIELSGRDWGICDLLDSSVPDSVKKLKGSVSLRMLTEACIKALGLTFKLIDKSKDKLADKKVKQQQTAESGQKIGDFLAKFAAKNQLYLFASPTGDLLVYKTEESPKRNSTTLVYGYSENASNNVLSASYEIDMTDVFASLKVRGQGAVGYDAKANKESDSVDVNDKAFDFNARPTRYIEIKLSEPTTNDNAKKRAVDEVNVRNARAHKYECEVPFFWDKEKKPYEIGDVFPVDDVMHQCFGDYLLGGFSVGFDIDGGTKASLKFSPPAAYSVVEFDEKSEKQKKGKGKKFVKEQTDTEKTKTKAIK